MNTTRTNSKGILAAWTVVLAAVAVQAAPSSGPTPSQRARRTPIVDVFERTKDAVVNIAATRIVERSSGMGMFDELFGGQRQPYQQTSLGSGAVIHPEGYVITNAHVVARAAKLKVIFANKTEHEAEAVSVDEQHDLAVLKIKGKGPFPAVTLGRSNDLMIGETVIAIGNPLGYEHTVTTGIISAINRELPVSDDVTYHDLIQTDTSINRGNSGGPLLNILGELIGLNTAIRSDAQNIGFAIPVDTVRKLLPEILSVERRRIEIGLRLGWRDRVYVVEASGPAEKAGVEVGDEVVRVDGQPIHQDLDYYVHVLNIDPKKSITVELNRKGKRLTATIQPKAIPVPDGAQLMMSKFGLKVQPLTAEQAQKLELEGGLLITDVEKGSPAAEAGFARGHIIVRVGRYFPNDMLELGRLLEKVGRGEKARFTVYEIRSQFYQVLEGELVAR